MSKTKKPRKAYKPKGVDINILNSFVGGFKRIDGEHKQVLAIKNSKALADMATGNGSIQSWNLITGFLNMANIMCERGVGDEYREDINAARDAALEIGKRYNVIGRFVFKGEELRLLNHALDIHEAQLDVSRIKDVEAAYVEIARRIRYNINTKSAQEYEKDQQKMAA